MASGIPLSSGFNLNTGVPLDSRSVVNTLLDRDAIPVIQRYIGLDVFVREDKKKYTLKSGVTNADWNISETKVMTPVFVITSTVQTGIHPSYITIPENCIIDSVTAKCTTAGTEDLELTIEKISASDFDTNTNWIGLLSSNLIIPVNKLSSSSNYIVSDSNINTDDVLRLKVIRSGTGVKGLTVQLKLKY